MMFFLKHNEILKLNVTASKICFLLKLLAYMGYIGMYGYKVYGQFLRRFGQKGHLFWPL